MVKYDDGDNRNFHVRQIQHGGTYQQLVKSGSAVVEDWKSHYDAMGLPASDRPNQFGPAAIHNDYPVDPAGRFRFTVGADGVIPGSSIANRVQETSQDSRWLANSWPSLARALGVFETGPLPAGGWDALPRSGSFRGADMGRSLGNLYDAVKATIPQHASRIPSTPFPAVIPQATVSSQGSLLVIESSARSIVVGKGRLEEFRRSTRVDPALRRVVSDEIRVIVITPGGRCEVRLGHRRS